jgi:hypothetical protein
LPGISGQAPKPPPAALRPKNRKHLAFPNTAPGGAAPGARAHTQAPPRIRRSFIRSTISKSAKRRAAPDDPIRAIGGILEQYKNNVKRGLRASAGCGDAKSVFTQSMLPPVRSLL